MPTADVCILGSINSDVIIRMDRFPQPGETVVTRGIRKTAGGKGANQAIAASRAGNRVTMLGAVGHDDDGDFLYRALERNGVDVAAVRRREDDATGLAHILLGPAGENMILVSPGANAAVSPRYVEDSFQAARVYGAQLEVPLEAVRTFFSKAREIGGLCILNAAPAVPEGKSLFALCDVIVMNEVELGSYVGAEIASQDLEAIAASARAFLSFDRQAIIITCGARGAVAVTRGAHFLVTPPPTRVVDTTGAGDCFCGYLAASLAADMPLREAVQRATVAASLSVAQEGAALSMPQAAEVTLTMLQAAGGDVNFDMHTLS
jgi:ribokinase